MSCAELGMPADCLIVQQAAADVSYVTHNCTTLLCLAGNLPESHHLVTFVAWHDRMRLGTLNRNPLKSNISY